MLEVTLRWPNGQVREVLLSGVPRKGDHVQVQNGPNEAPLVVEHILWVEAEPGELPSVIVVVRPFPS